MAAKYSLNQRVSWMGMEGTVLYEESPTKYKLRFDKPQGGYIEASVYESELTPVYNKDSEPIIDENG